MGYTIGDVLTVIAVIVGTLTSIWGMLVAFAMLFPRKAEHSRNIIQSRPWLCFGIGFLTALVGWTVAIFLLNVHNPIATLLGWLTVIAMVLLQAVGGSGMAKLTADRIQSNDKRRSNYRSLERGALLLVLLGLLPVIGWFFFTPVVNLISLGAGVISLFTKKRNVSPTTYTAAEFNANPGEFVV